MTVSRQNRCRQRKTAQCRQGEVLRRQSVSVFQLVDFIATL